MSRDLVLFFSLIAVGELPDVNYVFGLKNQPSRHKKGRPTRLAVNSTQLTTNLARRPKGMKLFFPELERTQVVSSLVGLGIRAIAHAQGTADFLHRFILVLFHPRTEARQ